MGYLIKFCLVYIGFPLFTPSLVVKEKDKALPYYEGLWGHLKFLQYLYQVVCQSLIKHFQRWETCYFISDSSNDEKFLKSEPKICQDLEGRDIFKKLLSLSSCPELLVCQSLCDDHGGDIGSDDTSFLLEITAEQNALRGGRTWCPAQKILNMSAILEVETWKE